ncbi:MAG: putative metalloprotease CJM1_0395 family protein [Candidatus Ozemobacteraceae bacterium]
MTVSSITRNALWARESARTESLLETLGNKNSTDSNAAANENSSIAESAQKTNSKLSGSSKDTKSADNKNDRSQKTRLEELERQDAYIRMAIDARSLQLKPGMQGLPTYEFVRGPDGKQYAVSGELPLNVEKVQGDPEATIQNAQNIRRVALSSPSPAPGDRMAAIEASRIEYEARLELARKQSSAQAPYSPEGRRTSLQQKPLFAILG